MATMYMVRAEYYHCTRVAIVGVLLEILSRPWVKPGAF